MSSAVAAAEPQRAPRAARRVCRLAWPGSETSRYLHQRAGHRVEPGVRARSQPVVGPPHDPHARCVDAPGSLEPHGIDVPDDREHLPAADRAPGSSRTFPPRHRGRRARQLVLRPAGAHAVGIEVALDGCRVALCDLAGRTLAEQQRSMCATGLDSSLDELALMVQDLIDDAEVPITTVVAVGLTATSSSLDAADGHGASTRGAPRRREWLRDGLERRLRMPVLCTSAVIAAARGEQWSGQISSRDFVYVHLASEIGCAVISHGQLCTGARGRGGESRTHPP